MPAPNPLLYLKVAANGNFLALESVSTLTNHAPVIEGGLINKYKILLAPRDGAFR
jgi:hypothetical protein